jgi:hypothetical protein
MEPKKINAKAVMMENTLMLVIKLANLVIQTQNVKLV